MKIEFTTEEIEVLKRLLSAEHANSSGMVNTIYISPAQQMRNAADAMEQKERDYPILRAILQKLLTPTNLE